jgi:hypothetical protein
MALAAADGSARGAIADGADAPLAPDETGAGEPAVPARAEPIATTAAAPEIPSRQATTVLARAR